MKFSEKIAAEMIGNVVSFGLKLTLFYEFFVGVFSVKLVCKGN